MKILPEPLEFEWDKGNIGKNLIKHNVTDKESEEPFVNKPNLIVDDEKHSTLETRSMIWGITNAGRNLSIIYTIRNNKVRVISARDMNKKERRGYEEKIKTNS